MFIAKNSPDKPIEGYNSTWQWSDYSWYQGWYIYQIMSICQAQVVRNGPCYAMQWWIQMTFSTANVHISQVHILSFPMQTTYTLTFFCVCCQNRYTTKKICQPAKYKLEVIKLSKIKVEKKSWYWHYALKCTKFHEQILLFFNLDMMT